MSARNGELLREARRQGWRVERRCGCGHLLLRHPEAARAVVISGTPGSPRSVRNDRAQLRRALGSQAAPEPKEASGARPGSGPLNGHGYTVGATPLAHAWCKPDGGCPGLGRT